MKITRVKRSQIDEWKRLRAALWPRCPDAQHNREIADILSDPEFNAVFIVTVPDKRAIGFIEASIRLTAEGCRPGLIGYIEGWYIEPAWTGKRVGTALVAKAEAWAMERGCKEMASDAEVENTDSREAHKRLGYEEVARLAHFRKDLRVR